MYKQKISKNTEQEILSEHNYDQEKFEVIAYKKCKKITTDQKTGEEIELKTERFSLRPKNTSYKKS